MRPIALVPFLALGLAAGTAHAESHATGDPAAGEKVFRKCKSCHMVEDDAGEAIQRGGRTGPNLYGVAGRAAGSVEDFRYSDAMSAAGEAGLVWTEETFAAYVADPSGYLREYLDDSGARGKMTFKLRDEEDAADVWAYLASVAPAPEMDGEAADK